MDFYAREKAAKSTLSGAGPVGTLQYPLRWRILPPSQWMKPEHPIQALKYSLKENSPRVFLKEKLLESPEC